MKKSFFTGIAILLPIAITIWFVNFFFDLLTKPFMFIVQSLFMNFGLASDDHPILLFIARIGILLLLLLVTLILGYVAQKFFFRYLIGSFQKMVKKIPIIKTIYQITEQTIDSVFSEKKNPFSQVVSVQFPSESVHCLGFLTASTSKSILKNNPNLTEVVFVPTAPHPISGFLIFTPKNTISTVDISPEDAFKILLSCGTFSPSSEKN